MRTLERAPNDERVRPRLHAITPRGKGGILWIEYYSAEELERMLERMGIKLSL